MLTERLEYRSSDGTVCYDFLFCYYDDLHTWRIYIIKPVPYPDTAYYESFHYTHRLHDAGEDYDYICWGGTISTLTQAKAVASVWGDVTAIMIRTGRPFDVIFNEIKNRND